jgi:hypothetical protein
MEIFKYKFLWAAILSVVFIAVGVMVYLLLQDETANWNVFRNEVYGFAFKYPKEWEVWSQRYTGDKERRPIMPDSVNIVFGLPSYGKVSLIVRRNQQVETVEGIIESFQGGQGEKVILGRPSFIERLFNPEDGEDNVIIAVKFQNSWENEQKEKWSSRLFYIPHGNLTLVLSEVMQVNSSARLKIIEQMVETVEFFETADVTAWDSICAFPEFRSFELAIRQGEGATHIARSVLKAYVNAVVLKNPEDKKDLYFLPEEKVYSEDYIIKRLTIPDLYYAGDIVKIPCILVEEAATKARQLTLRQRGTLKEYGEQVPGFETIQQIRNIINQTATSSGLPTPFLFEGGR